MKKLILTIVALAIFVAVAFTAFAQTCKTSEECQKLISEYQQKLDSVRQQKSSLSAQIQLMDTQIYLTTLKIHETEFKITQTEADIEKLNGRIEGLNSSLDYLSKLLLKKIAEGYKRREVPFINIFLDSDNASMLANRLKYARTAEENDRRVAFQLQKSKLNFEEQKTLREEKKVELDQLKVQLDNQEAALNNQKDAKQKLLADTQNSESVYQQLLSRARAQAAAFTSFVRSSGAGSIVGANALGSGSDGSYYSQRDERWANQTIGNSSETVLNVGCLISSVAMALKKNGVDTSPGAIASNANYFSANTAYMNYRWSMNPWPNGLNSYQLSTSHDVIDGELNSGHYVIVGVNGCSHFVVLIKKDGDDYIMHDPLYGPDLKFSSHYSGFCSAETFK